jgi:uncharacterized protein (TIGR02001 family)
MNVKNYAVLGVALACFFVPFETEAATTIGDFELSANVGLVSQYSFRGIAQSNENPALQGGFDISHSSGLYAGVWASNVDFNDGDEAHIETDLYAGYANTVDKFSYDLGVIYYAYPGADSSLDYDYWEGKFELGYDFDIFSATAALYYSPDFFAGSGDALYSMLGVDVPLPADFSLSGHVGYQAVDDNAAFAVPDYTDWSVGLGYTYEGFDFSLQYIDTDLDEPGECADGCAERVIFGISRSF